MTRPSVSGRVAGLFSITAYVSVAVVSTWEIATTRWDLDAQVVAVGRGRVHPQSLVLLAHLVCLAAWLLIAWRTIGHVRRGVARGRHPSRPSEHPRGVSGMLALACAGVVPSLSTPSVAVVEVRRSRKWSSASDVERSTETSSSTAAPSVDLVTVHVFGYPIIEGSAGRRAVFRKSRALELLVWLSLNRDRQRRSTARTAIWDGDIGDSSFATVVSEMRRALVELDPDSDPQSWCPPSYTDEMALAPRVVTDADLLEQALARFRRDPDTAASDLVGLTSRIRDMPFAGAGYLWPDVDGTTTRLMILGLDAVTELTDWAVDSGDVPMALAALASGLRMMPGDADLLERQRALLARPRRTRDGAPRSRLAADFPVSTRRFGRVTAGS